MEKSFSSRASIEALSSRESEKLFDWNPTKPRPICEIDDKKFSARTNTELKAIGGFGRAECVKKNPKAKKLLANFSLTEDAKPVVCKKKKNALNIREHVERVKFAENSPQSHVIAKTKTKVKYDHQNPFNLDFEALDDYQRQVDRAKAVRRRRNAQIARRKMETKRLETEGAEEIMREERCKKFGLPAFFDIDSETPTRKIDVDKTDSSKSEARNVCTAVSVLDKEENRKIVKRHYEHKREKLRQRLLAEKASNERAQEETQKREQDEQENLIFRLADESMAECDGNYVQELEAKLESLNVGRPKMEFSLPHLVEDLPCGQRRGTEILLRGFHDPLYKVVRGRDHLHFVERVDDDALSPSKRVDALLNDPRVVSDPPKAKLLSTLNRSRDPNDDKTWLFSAENSRRTTERLGAGKKEASAIRQHIQQIDSRMRNRNCKSKVRKMRGASEACEREKHRLQRMKFMGIPTGDTRNEIELIVSEISRRKKESTSNGRRRFNAENIAPEDVRLVPAIPELPLCVEEEEEKEKEEEEEEERYEHSEVTAAFSDAKPRGNNPEMLRIDKSLPWIKSDVEAMRAQLASDLDVESKTKKKRSECNAALDNGAHVACDKRKIADENRSDLKRCYNEIIAAKFSQNCGTEQSAEQLRNDDESNDFETHSSLSSDGTNFTNDSGSYVVVLNEKIPKMQLNMANKYQNKSHVTTSPLSNLEENPFFHDSLDVMHQLMKPPDRFHTHRTRLNAKIRERLRVDSVAREGSVTEDESRLTTDSEENLFKEEKFHFKCITEMAKSRERFRKTVETFYMSEKLVRDEMQEEEDSTAMHQINATTAVYENFLEQQKEQANRRAMKRSEEINGFLVKTEELRRKHDEMQAQLELLKMRIFVIGMHFAKLVRMQNFQYLLMPYDWRVKHDHLHRAADGSLECARKSISEREVKNLWDFNDSSVDAIVSFIENDFAAMRCENLKTFTHPDMFSLSYERITSRSLQMLAKFTHAAMKYGSIQREKAVCEENWRKWIEQFELRVKILRDRQRTFEKRFRVVRGKVMSVAAEPMEKSFKSPQLNQLAAVISLMYQKFVCGDRHCGAATFLTSEQKLEQIENKVCGIFERLNKIPAEIIPPIEREIRLKRSVQFRVARRAHDIEIELEDSMRRLRRLLAKPPARKTRLDGEKLQRFYLKSKPKPRAPSPKMSAVESDYMKAFAEVVGDEGSGKVEVKFDDTVKELILKIKNESAPFYVDKFLEVHGCSVSKMTKADEERILEEEKARMKFTELWPEVERKWRFWELLRERTKRETIEKTIWMYRKED